MTTSQTVQRYDYSEFKATKTDEGFLVDSPIVARVGIQEYRRADGTIRRELRLPQEVFAPEALASLRGRPVTADHPKSGKVDSQTAHRVTIGTMLSEGRQDGNNVRVDMVIHSPDAIGNRRELSLGYTAHLDETPGVHPEFGSYDAVQRNISVNHLSVVHSARAGKIARLNLDGNEDYEDATNGVDLLAKAIAIHEKHMNGKLPTTGPEGEKSQMEMMDLMKEAFNLLSGKKDMKMNNDSKDFFNQQEQTTMTTVKVKLDNGIEYDAAPEVSVELAKLRSDASDAKSKLDAVTAQRDTLQAKVDAQKDEIEKAKAQGRADALERLSLEAVATKFKVDHKDKTDRQIKEAVIATVRKDADLKDKSDVYVDAAFDMAIEALPDANMASQRKAVNDGVDEPTGKYKTARERYADSMAALANKEAK